MKKPKLKAASALVLVLGLSTVIPADISVGGVTLQSGAAAAQETKLPGCKAPPERRRLASLTQRFFTRVAEVDKLTNPEPDSRTGVAPQPDYQAAWPRIKALVDRCEGCNEYELAQVYLRAATIRYNLDDIAGALDYFKKTIAQSPNIPETLEAQLTYQVAQLLTADEKNQEALRFFDKWETLCPAVVPDDYFYFRAQNLYTLNRRDEALREIGKAVRLAESKGNVPREAWWRLEYAIHLDKEDFKAAERVAEKLAVNYTNSRILTQLASLYGMNGREKDQMALMDALYQAGVLETENQFRNLAFLFLGAEAPYLGYKVLDKGLSSNLVKRDLGNLETLATTLIHSQELQKAIPVLEEAAAKADHGRLYEMLAPIYLELEQFDKAIDAGRKAINRKGLRSEGLVQIYVAQALIQQKKYDEAIRTAEAAFKDERYRSHAQNVVRYARSVKEREEALARDREAAAAEAEAG